MKMRYCTSCSTASSWASMPVLGWWWFLSVAKWSVRAIARDATAGLVWEARTPFPGGVGRHHPITFANATHGFVLSGSTEVDFFTSDFWVYEAATDAWTDLTDTAAAFPGEARSFGYGVAASSSVHCDNDNDNDDPYPYYHHKVYLGLGAGRALIRAWKPLTDWWEFDTSTHVWKRLADFPGAGRRHPAVNFVEPMGEIHVGLGDGYGGNYDDWWSYDIRGETWRRLEDFPSTPRHHPFHFALGTDSYVGLGHSDGTDPLVERDWYRYDALNATWHREADFASYRWGHNATPVTTEARVAGTQFTVTASPSGSCDDEQRRTNSTTTNNNTTTLGFVLSGDGDDHYLMETGEFHVFDTTTDDNAPSVWHPLPPHPGKSRWAPGSFVLQGSTRVYLFGGYDREQQMLHSDLWTMDLQPLFDGTVGGGSDDPGIENSTMVDPSPPEEGPLPEDNPPAKVNPSPEDNSPANVNPSPEENSSTKNYPSAVLSLMMSFGTLVLFISGLLQ